MKKIKKYDLLFKKAGGKDTREKDIFIQKRKDRIRWQCSVGR